VAATAAVLTLMAAPVPAHAADGDVRVTVDLGDSITTGRPHGVNVRFRNNTNTSILDVRAAITVHLDGLQPDAVSLTSGGQELPKASNGSDVIFTDLHAFATRLRAGSSASRTYTITFDPSVPPGSVDVTATALDAFGQQLGSGSATADLRQGNGASPSRTPSPSKSAPPPVNVPLPTGTVSIAPLGGDGGRTTPLSNDDSGGIATLPYILGAFLVLIGGAILWLLLRKPKTPAQVAQPAWDGDGDYAVVRPPTLGYPSGPRAAAPTAMMPVVTDERTATMPRHGSAVSGPAGRGAGASLGGGGLVAGGGPRPTRDVRPQDRPQRDPGRHTSELPVGGTRPTLPTFDPWADSVAPDDPTIPPRG
jgi:hypothetical protein